MRGATGVYQGAHWKGSWSLWTAWGNLGERVYWWVLSVHSWLASAWPQWTITLAFSCLTSGLLLIAVLNLAILNKSSLACNNFSFFSRKLNFSTLSSMLGAESIQTEHVANSIIIGHGNVRKMDCKFHQLCEFGIERFVWTMRVSRVSLCVKHWRSPLVVHHLKLLLYSSRLTKTNKQSPFTKPW